jgi:hypothetical protein
MVNLLPSIVIQLARIRTLGTTRRAFFVVETVAALSVRWTHPFR